MYSNIGVLTSFLFEYFILVGRGGEGYNLSSCSQIMSGVVDVGNDNLSIGSCLVQNSLSCETWLCCSVEGSYSCFGRWMDCHAHRIWTYVPSKF